MDGAQQKGQDCIVGLKAEAAHCFLNMVSFDVQMGREGNLKGSLDYVKEDSMVIYKTTTGCKYEYFPNMPLNLSAANLQPISFSSVVSLLKASSNRHETSNFFVLSALAYYHRLLSLQSGLFYFSPKFSMQFFTDLEIVSANLFLMYERCCNCCYYAFWPCHLGR